MKQTALQYAILGDGRLAQHLRHFLTLEGQRVHGWARNPKSSFNSYRDTDPEARLRATLEGANRVLLLVSDDALAPLLRQYPFLHQHRLVHCAGALSLPGVTSAHPLMTFGQDLYDHAAYQAIPFMVEEGQSFEDLFPGLPNASYPVQAGQKALYHALCVSAGNFPQLLWQAVGERLQQELGVPPAALGAYLQQSLDNFLEDPQGALTGPLARGDRATLERNQAALNNHELGDLFAAFVKFHGARTGRQLERNVS